MFEVLRDLARDPARRADVGTRGIEFVRRTHDTRVVGKKLLEVYREMLGATAR